jgi:hypothetical protein
MLFVCHNRLKYEVSTILREGRVARPALGVRYLEGTQARALGIEKGILVLDVQTGSSAEKAGVQRTTRSAGGRVILGDILVGMDDDDITSESDLFRGVITAILIPFFVFITSIYLYMYLYLSVSFCAFISCVFSNRKAQSG